jgi:N6-adenosine-specific RNA methylase IME4
METIATTELRVHEDATLVPDMRPVEYAELLADVRERGINVPLDVVDCVVLDGRHRLRAARELALPRVPVRQAPLNGDTATEWMLKAAVLRRHLTDDQRATVARMYEKQNPQRKPGPGRGRTITSTHTGRGSLSARSRAAEHPARGAASKLMNVAPTRIEKAALVDRADPQLFAQVHRGEVKLAQAVRQVRQEQVKEQVKTLPKPDGLYEVIVIDPPWQYDRQPADSGMRGEVDYATMSPDQLQALKLPAAPNCVLWLWTTNSFMREAYDLLEAWGFEAKTILTWDKVHMGLGSWLRNVTEHCILAVRGRPLVTLTNQTTLLREARREHSRKPEAFYALVESLCPGRKYEHFSRTPRPGWTGYGVEHDRFVSA